MTDLSRLSLEELQALRDRASRPSGSSPSLRRNPALKDASLEELVRMREALNPAYTGGEVRPFGISTGIKTSPALDQFISGGGKAFADPVLGARQMVGAASQEE